MELSLPHTLHLFNIFREYDGKENCAQLIEKKIIMTISKTMTMYIGIDVYYATFFL